MCKSRSCGNSQSDVESTTQNEQSSNPKLRELSSFILKERGNLNANTNDLAYDLHNRSARLWVEYSSKGINLSTGGVETSFIQPSQVFNSPSLQTFNMYQNYVDTGMTLDQLKKFFLEEQVLSPQTNLDNLHINFCLGSHEGVMRVARCIRSNAPNEIMFLPVSSYGLLAMALRNMQPLHYTLKFLPVNTANGEKLCTQQLERAFKFYPNRKSLYLELKTMAGAIYNSAELNEIVILCKKYNIFLIADGTHIHMEYDSNNAFPNIHRICLENNFYAFSLIYTASKTYGLERARVGFILMDSRNPIISPSDVDTDLARTLGTVNDMPMETASILIKSEMSSRRAHTRALANKLRFNMNLIIAYIEGVNSPNIDSDITLQVKSAIPLQYRDPIPGVKIVFKPEGGMHIKLDVSDLQNKFYSNIQIFNSEIFCYVFNIISNVVTLHSYCLMDAKCQSVRISYSIENDVHLGLQALANFVKTLTNTPSINPYMPDLVVDKKYIKSLANEQPQAQSSFFQSSNSNSNTTQTSHMPIFKAKL